MAARDIDAHDRAAALRGPVFFDRGLPDIVGYRRLAGLPPSASLEADCRARRYHRRVFIAPPWPAIYATDGERRQTPAEAELTYRMMAEVYPAFGYDLVELPRVPIAERVAFVREALGWPAKEKPDPKARL